MLLSNRQRLVAGAGLLTLLGWMAVTIAFNNPPRLSSAGDALLFDDPQQPDSKTPRAIVEVAVAASTNATPAAGALPPSMAPLSALVTEPKVKLPPATGPIPSGTVIRMGRGIHVHPEARIPQECLQRSANGARQHAPIP